MDLETIKSISSIAAPMTKVLIETFLKPKMQYLKEKYTRENSVIDHFFENTFADYLNQAYEKNSTLNTVAFKRSKIFLKDVYIPLTIYNSDINILINEIENQIFVSNKILIIDYAGMGKSTLSKKLILSSIEKNYGIPILVELRRLNKSKDIIQEIIEQLKPINEEINKRLVLDLIKRGDFIFFFDGYDEILISEKVNTTSEINNFVEKAGNNKFVMTSRPEEALSAFGGFDRFSIRNLNFEESLELIRKYGNDSCISKLLIEKISEPEILNSIEEYLASPLLVSLLYAAFEYKQKIPFQKHNFYRQVFDSLFESHDLSKGDSYERDKYTKLSLDEFHKILRYLAFNCLKKDNKIEFTKDEFTNIIDKTKNEIDDLNLNTSDLIKDLLITVPIFTQDGLYYKWTHKSLQEYFAAQFIYCDAKQNQKILLEHIAFHHNNSIFYNTLDLYSSIDPEFFNQTVVYKFLKLYIKFYYESYEYVKDVIDKTFRIQISFTHLIYLVRCTYGATRSASEIFRLIRKHNSSIKSLSISLIDFEENISFVKIPIIVNNYFSISKLLSDKGYDFMDRLKSHDGIIDCNDIKINLDLEDRKVYELTRRKNSILNKPENFNKVNDFIRIFLCNRNIPVINLEKAEAFIERIELMNKRKNTNDLINF